MTDSEKNAIGLFLKGIEGLAFEIAPPNSVTPRIVDRINAFREIMYDDRLVECLELGKLTLRQIYDATR